MRIINQSIDLITIQGIVIPVEWDKKGNVIATAICTYNEVEYMVDRDEIGNQLLSNIRKKIEARGLVIREKEKKKIKIQNYRILNVY